MLARHNLCARQGVAQRRLPRLGARRTHACTMRVARALSPHPSPPAPCSLLQSPCPGAQKGPYPVGVDPGWHGTRTELPYLNSLKMKMSIILGGCSVPLFPSFVLVLLVFLLWGRRVWMGPLLCAGVRAGCGQRQGGCRRAVLQGGAAEGAPGLGWLANVMTNERSRRCKLHCKLPL